MPSRRFDSLRDERHVSPRINDAATAKRNPSANILAPFSTALYTNTSQGFNEATVIARTALQTADEYVSQALREYRS